MGKRITADKYVNLSDDLRAYARCVRTSHGKVYHTTVDYRDVNGEWYPWGEHHAENMVEARDFIRQSEQKYTRWPGRPGRPLIEVLA
jgi:hypothetical protein